MRIAMTGFRVIHGSRRVCLSQPFELQVCGDEAEAREPRPDLVSLLALSHCLDLSADIGWLRI